MGPSLLRTKLRPPRLLQRRTEGWSAGVQFSALSLQVRDDVDEFLTAFSGSHHHVVDYLMSEVFEGFSEQIQVFLLRAAQRADVPGFWYTVMGSILDLDRAWVDHARGEEERAWARVEEVLPWLMPDANVDQTLFGLTIRAQIAFGNHFSKASSK